MPKVKRQSSDKLLKKDNNFNKRESDLIGLVNNMVDYDLKHTFPRKYEIVKNYLQFNGDLESTVAMIQKQSGSSVKLSASIYPLLQQSVDTFYSNALDSLPQTRAVAFEHGDEKAAMQAQDFYDWAYTISDALRERNGAIMKDNILLGNGYGMFSLEDKMGKRVPTLKHVSYFNVFCEPIAKSFYESRYKVRRRLVATESLYRSYNRFAKWTEKNDEYEKFLKKPLISDISENGGTRLYDRDFDRIWNINSYATQYRELCEAYFEDKNNQGTYWNGLELQDSELFKIEDDHNRIHEVYEVRDGDYLSIICDGHLIFDGDAPIRQPFGVISYDENPGSARGIGLGDKLLDQQRKATFFWNGIENGIKMHLYPDYYSDGNLKDSAGNPVGFHTRSGGKVYTRDNGFASTGGGSVLQPIAYIDHNFIDRARLQLNEIRMEAQQISGLNSYVVGGTTKIERSAAGVQAKTAAFRSRLKHMSMSLTRFDNHGFHSRLELCHQYIGKEIHARIIADGQPKYLDISLEDIRCKFDIITNDEGNRLATKAERLQNRINLLNILDKYMFDQNGLPILDIKDFLKKTLQDVDMLAEVPIFDEKNLKKYIDMVTNIQKYQQEKALEAQQELQAMQQPPTPAQPVQQQPQQLPPQQQAQIPFEGLLPEELAALGISPEEIQALQG